ncbi:LPS export ABC transporter periplasmic protein LptC [Desulfohalobiaceae bacterium Ax17]|uniref:LPS export ABC transporter periplasmic protein LptC n=1 Tax=Desulfovulcanus ferrireducens TaxID=2831190 RepID=UPI00207BAD77|nr:LPS export ABC transporter periplasmic protein LptC [Desulfovulcanus ferrireducens]MBT8763400.1 LPS export ABC transporter periplasmic protein LptC [Desulfovulcanus ferrireducens]
MLKKIIPFFFIGFFMVFFIWRWPFSFTPDRLKKIDLAVDLSLQGIALKQGRDGHITWELMAKKGTYSEETKEFFLDEPKITYYFGQDRKKLNVLAPQGKVNQQKDQAELWPQVTAFYQDLRVKAERVEYRGRSRKIFLQGKVELVKRDMRISAESAVIDLDKETIEATGGVKTVVFRQEAKTEEIMRR